ncbi:hypothetical protein LUZ60_015054 [Juncus effusus]|nr:hypothetical protein LUZ60_015054 [Juncus effusus]
MAAAVFLPSLLSKSTSLLHYRRLPLLRLSSVTFSSSPSKSLTAVKSPSKTAAAFKSDQSITPAAYFQALAESDGKSKSKKFSKKISSRTTKEAAIKPAQSKYSKAARRFYNEHIKKKPDKQEEETVQRLNKALAAAGVASRRNSDELIFQGKVTVNGTVCTTPHTRVDISKDSIYVNGNRIAKRLPRKFYFALNKPKGYICSCGEESKSVVSLFDEFFKGWSKKHQGVPQPRLFTVGRLDVATTGLIIVTNDGDFAQRLSHPSSELSKEYIATIDGLIHKRHLIAVSEGTIIEGIKCVPDSVELMPAQPDQSKPRIKIVVHQGKNHEVRELVKNAGLNLYSLKRVRIGRFRLPADLGIGKFVELKDSDMKLLDGKSQKSP